MLQPTEKDYLADKERYKELIRQAERERLISSAIQQHACNVKTRRRLFGWVGDQMAKRFQRH